MSFKLDREDLGDLAEINVTPLVDVMLVLLIIFMVTAPMLTQGLTVALPAAEVPRFSFLSRAAVAGAAVSGALHRPPVESESVINIKFAPLPAAAPAPTLPVRTASAPQPKAEQKPKTAPPSPFGRSEKKA